MKNDPSYKKAKGQILSGVLEMPVGTFGQSAHIELFSNQEALIDGCKGILEYTDTMVKINTGNTIISFLGSSMEIKSLAGDQAIIHGIFVEIKFS